ncbi:hypothetical protein IX329_001004 [Fusobacterium necrophorum]|nr:hypothetical protein [Fusobacterium necrophorum]MBR8733430.1 hypothetical protein [Fusobacterium necrophorum]MBR8789607.1 hypothetical protein [Fusobacterium necrophorum]
METKIIQKFKGEINGVEFSNEYIYRTVEYVGNAIEEKFGLLSQNFIKDLRGTIETVSLKYESFDFSVLENSILESLENAKFSKELFINYDGLQWKMEEINKNLMKGKYQFKEEEKYFFLKKYNLFREKVLYELPIDIKELEKRENLTLCYTNDTGTKYDIEIIYDINAQKEIITSSSEFLEVEREIPRNFQEMGKILEKSSLDSLLDSKHTGISYEVLDSLEKLKQKKEDKKLQEELKKLDYKLTFNQELQNKGRIHMEDLMLKSLEQASEAERDNETIAIEKIERKIPKKSKEKNDKQRE